ncbi:MAG: class I SAM-dependent methyltransferase [Magnetococcales bacterium]|nr:class I SAM-dependent methyltransferase [Magnetococcales bacterium]
MNASSPSLEAAFEATRCLFCPEAPARELFPRRLDPARLGGYAFSARRQRTREHYRLVTCTGCGLVRSDPILPEAVINRWYRESAFLFSGEAAFAATTYAALLQRLRTSHPGASAIGSLCEIGCSTGFFMERCLEMGITDQLGFEPSLQCRERADPRVRDWIVPAPFTPEAAADRRFDLLAGFHVFDHLRDPRQALAQAAELLNPGGFVLLVCHDVAAPLARLLGRFNPIFDVEHIYLFSTQTIARLLEACGFQVLEIGALGNTYPLAYWLRMAPGGRWLGALVPEPLARRPVTLKAGNLYAFGRRRG